MSLAVLSCLTGEKGSEAWEWQDSLASRYVHLGCTKFSTDLWVSEFENQNTNRGDACGGPQISQVSEMDLRIQENR